MMTVMGEATVEFIHLLVGEVFEEDFAVGVAAVMVVVADPIVTRSMMIPVVEQSAATMIIPLMVLLPVEFLPALMIVGVASHLISVGMIVVGEVEGFSSVAGEVAASEEDEVDLLVEAVANMDAVGSKFTTTREQYDNILACRGLRIMNDIASQRI